MIKYRRKQLLNIVEELVQENERIELYAQSQLMESLAHCQEQAIELGNDIEARGAVGNSLVSCLEDYCECIYQQSLVLFDYVKRSKNQKIVHGLLMKIENGIRHDLPEDKVEMVFLPYKASMWDSLESVWMAARDDVNCDVYVVPIPYFDKNNDGSLGEMHYEGNQYPEYVPVISWQEYDIEERKPDAIFIHNPYDNGNYVTSVHPYYYSRNLKKYTEMLVYIPYFVCIEDMPEHLLVLPGVIHADRVIVQSEKVRQQYICEFHKFEDNYNCKGRFGTAEEKFMAIGSPKYDKVIGTNRDNISIPSDWWDKIKNKDDTLKKVILYNTSVSKLLDGDEALKKLKSVIEFFQEKEDAVLLWRPHPLSESTCAVLRPKLLEEYRKIVEQFKIDNMGIYDDTSDLNRAIAVSDAYYGDSSSLVGLYQLTGKPIMIQNTSFNTRGTKWEK